MSFHGGFANAERVKRICARARRIIALGLAAEEAQESVEDRPCECRYPDGRVRFVRADGTAVHQCGRKGRP